MAPEELHELLEQCQRGERRAQYRIYQQYATAMYNICLRLMYHQPEAQDMLQEAFLQAFQRIDQYRATASFGAWLKRIVVNTCIDHLRKRRLDLQTVEDVPEPTPQREEEETELILQVEKVKDAIMQLPEGFRVVFSLYLLEGYDHLEIAKILGISESTSKSQYSRAKQKIRDILKKNHHDTKT